MESNLTITPTECTDILSENGFGIGYDKLTQGMRHDADHPERRIFPFGDAFKMQSGNWAYIIYRKKLMDFIRDRGGETAS